MHPRIYADFNKQDSDGRLVLTCAGTYRDLRHAGLVLKDGLELVFYADDADEQGKPDDLEVEGVVQFDDKTKRWVGVFDPRNLRHASDRRE